jgi:hypothetical protein
MAESRYDIWLHMTNKGQPRCKYQSETRGTSVPLSRRFQVSGWDFPFVCITIIYQKNASNIQDASLDKHIFRQQRDYYAYLVEPPQV